MSRIEGTCDICGKPASWDEDQIKATAGMAVVSCCEDCSKRLRERDATLPARAASAALAQPEGTCDKT